MDLRDFEIQFRDGGKLYCQAFLLTNDREEFVSAAENGVVTQMASCIIHIVGTGKLTWGADDEATIEPGSYMICDSGLYRRVETPA